MFGKAAKTLFVAMIAWLACGPVQAKPFVDSYGRTVELPDKITRVLPAGPPAAVAVYAVAPDKMIGWPHPFSAEAEAFIAPAYRSLPVVGRITAREPELTPAEIKALKPDVIVDFGSLDPRYAALADKIQAETGIPYVLIDGRLYHAPDSLRMVGEAVGEPAAGAALAQAAENLLSRAATATKMYGPTVYFARGENGLETGGTGSTAIEIIEIAGARNAAENAGDGTLKVTLEQLRQWNPDAIVAANAALAEKIRANPGWQSLRAVKAGKVYGVPSDPWGWADTPPSINRLIGPLWLASRLSPKAKIDIAAETRKFYRTFYHVDLTPEQVRQLTAK